MHSRGYRSRWLWIDTAVSGKTIMAKKNSCAFVECKGKRDGRALSHSQAPDFHPGGGVDKDVDGTGLSPSHAFKRSR